MKKVLGTTFIVITALMIFNVSAVHNSDVDLANLIALNTANAEDYTVTIKDCDDASPWDTCSNNNNFPGCDNSLFWDTCEATVSG